MRRSPSIPASLRVATTVPMTRPSFIWLAGAFTISFGIVNAETLWGG